MKGMLVKDMIYLRGQWKSLLIMAMCGLAMSAALQAPSMILYVTLLGMMVALGTLSADELDRGYSWLLTLPVTRKSYVRAKYLFTAGVVVCCALLSLLVTAVLIRFQESDFSAADLVTAMLLSLAMNLFIMAVTLPLRIKYGSQKGQIMMIAVLAVLVGGIVLLVKQQGGTLAQMTSAPAGWVKAALPAAALAAAAVSEKISERILEKKEF